MLGLDLGLWRLDGSDGPVAPPPPPPDDGSAFAYNLGFARHFSTNRPFLNLIKLAQYWTANNGASVPLDGDAYPTAMPAGASYLFAILFVNDVETGLLSQDIHVFWDGDGVVELGDGGSVQFSEANHFIYTPTSGVHRFDITDFGTTGVTNMRVVRDDHLARLNAGEIYNPDWLSIVSKAKILRFLNWMPVNSANSDQLWADRPTLTRFSYLNRIPYELVVDICNQAGADLWFQTRHRVEQALIEGVAALVRDTLDQSLTCYLEYSNETWNFSFDQNQYFIAKGVEDWGTQASGLVSLTQGTNTVTGTGTAFLSDLSPSPVVVAADGQLIEVASIQSDTEYTTSRLIRRDATDVPIFHDSKYQRVGAYVKYATQVAKWWQAVHPDRCKHLLGAQVSSSSDVQALIDAADWQANEPAAWEERNVTFDGIAIATYYGSNVRDSAIIADLNAGAAISDAEMLSRLDGYLRDPADVTSLPGLTFKLRTHHRACRAAGLELYSYEGGSHIIHPGGSVSNQERNDLLAHFTTWVNSDDFLTFNDDLLDACKSFVDGPFMQFDAVSGWTNTTAWGAYQTPDYVGDKRTEHLDGLAAAGRFWGGDIAPQTVKPLPDITGSELQDIGLVRLDTRFTSNTLTFSAEGLPAGLSVDPAFGDITGTPDGGAAGTGTYTITATNAAGSVQATGAYDIAAHVPVDPVTIANARVYDLTDGATLSSTTGPASFGIASGATVAEIANIGDASGFNLILDEGTAPVFDGGGVVWTADGILVSGPVPITGNDRSIFVAANVTSAGGIAYGGAGTANQRSYLGYSTSAATGAVGGGFGNDGFNDVNDDLDLRNVNAVIGFTHDGNRNRLYVNGVEEVDVAASGSVGADVQNAIGAYRRDDGNFFSIAFRGRIFGVVDVPFVVSDAQRFDITNWLTARMS